MECSRRLACSEDSHRIEVVGVVVFCDGGVK